MARGDERRQVIEEFDEAVNMTPKELEEWLQTDESESARATGAASPRATSRAAGSSRSSERRGPPTQTTTSPA